MLPCSIMQSMIRKIIEAKAFTKEVESFLKKKSLSPKDYDNFKKELTLHPELGDIIVAPVEFAR